MARTHVPPKAQRLCKEAREAAQSRGHTLGRFFRSTSPTMPSHYIGDAKCTTCGKEVRVDTHPAPNGIEVGGEAVAMECEEA